MARSSHVLLTDRQFFVNRWLWYCVIALAIGDGLWVWLSHLRVVVAGEADSTVPIIALCVFILLGYKRFYRDDNLFMFVSVLLQMIALGGALGVLSYLTAGFNYPLQDEAFRRL